MKKQATVLLTIIIVLLFLGVLGMSLLGFLFLRTTSSTLAIDRLKAFYLAEAGIAKSINELKKEVDYDHNGIGNIAPCKLGDGVFWAQHDFQTSTITATGEVNGIKRSLQIKYAIF